MTPLHMPLFLLLFQQLRNHFCTDLPHPQIFRNDCPHPLAVHFQLIYNHSNNQAAISMHFLADKLDVYLGCTCGRALVPRVIFRILPSLLKPPMPLNSPSSQHCVIPIHILHKSECFCWNFPSRTGNFKLVCWSVVIVCYSKNCGPKFFTTINARLTTKKSLQKSVQLTQNEISYMILILEWGYENDWKWMVPHERMGTLSAVITDTCIAIKRFIAVTCCWILYLKKNIFNFFRNCK